MWSFYFSCLVLFFLDTVHICSHAILLTACFTWGHMQFHGISVNIIMFKCTFSHKGTQCNIKHHLPSTLPRRIPCLLPCLSPGFSLWLWFSFLPCCGWWSCFDNWFDMKISLSDLRYNIKQAQWANTCRWFKAHLCRYDEGTEEDKKQQKQLELHGGCWSDCQSHRAILSSPLAVPE